MKMLITLEPQDIFNQILHFITFKDFLETDVQNGDYALPRFLSSPMGDHIAAALSVRLFVIILCGA